MLIIKMIFVMLAYISYDKITDKCISYGMLETRPWQKSAYRHARTIASTISCAILAFATAFLNLYGSRITSNRFIGEIALSFVIFSIIFILPSIIWDYIRRRRTL